MKNPICLFYFSRWTFLQRLSFLVLSVFARLTLPSAFTGDGGISIIWRWLGLAYCFLTFPFLSPLFLVDSNRGGNLIIQITPPWLKERGLISDLHACKTGKDLVMRVYPFGGLLGGYGKGPLHALLFLAQALPPRCA